MGKEMVKEHTLGLSGSRYVGEWKDDKKDGQGTYIYGKGKLKGDKYVGEIHGWI